ncbi:MAG: SUF system Fe-S cluster assembly protein [Marinilabiliaceae bacterium]|nr:SUF system Fe-S cluster assembly protein [Bacteroidales bacterium]MDY4520726.1 SUF system Fe-S cluster assembly protein [Bacteroidales bacterium]
MESENQSEKTLEERVIEQLKTIFDPEIPVNIYDLGLIYKLEISTNNDVRILMTLTAPNCPVADSLPEEVMEKVREVEGVTSVEVNLTFDPVWSQDNLSDEARLELGLL